MPRHLCNRDSLRQVTAHIPVGQLESMVSALDEVIGNGPSLFMPCIDMAEKIDEGIYSVEAGAFKRDVEGLKLLCTKATNKLGKMTVRYLGDLKEQVYPLDTILFNATKDDNHGLDLKQTIKEALFSTEDREVRLVNLANVRDIVIVPGKCQPDLHGKIKYVTEMVELFHRWIADGDEVFVTGGDS